MKTEENKDASDEASNNFIRHIIENDMDKNKNQGRLQTRFPPEPNGHLHIGHAKAICLNFGMAKDYPNALCNLRFDDTNPEKESNEYAEAIMESIRWLGFDWQERLYYASDYFPKLYDYAISLINKGSAYVCELGVDEMRRYRGSLTEAGQNSPYRERSIEDNLALFEQMKQGEFEEGRYVLRAKIDMASPNMNLRDPIIYRIRHIEHHRTGTDWCIYPMYDFTHCLSDMIEEITHSLCTMEFADHRPLYDWFLEQIEAPCHPQQIEFARLNLNYTITSKRKLNRLVEAGHVQGWDDPRMPTLIGLRRRGYTPAALRDFCERIGITKKDTVIEMGLLESCIRDDLGSITPRVLAVLNPLKVVIENLPADADEMLEAPFHPQDESFGHRKLRFSREIYIDHDDFMEDPPKKFFRLGPGREVRLRYGYIIKCEAVIKDPQSGEVIELRCSYDPATKSGSDTSGRKVKGTIHWVSAKDCIRAEIRLYDRLFNHPNPASVKDDGDFTDHLNPESLTVKSKALLEPSMSDARVGARFQFERQGYFSVDVDSTDDNLVFNRVVSLRDSWAKIDKQRRQ